MFEFARAISTERQYEASQFRLAASVVRRRRQQVAVAKAADRSHPTAAR
jgi:hypothetical protein